MMDINEPTCTRYLPNDTDLRTPSNSSLNKHLADLTDVKKPTEEDVKRLKSALSAIAQSYNNPKLSRSASNVRIRETSNSRLKPLSRSTSNIKLAPKGALDDENIWKELSSDRNKFKKG